MGPKYPGQPHLWDIPAGVLGFAPGVAWAWWHHRTRKEIKNIN
jgi:hypothetical protein